MSAQDSPVGIISQQVFDQYSSRWVEVIGNNDTSLLNQCFQANRQKLPHVTFPALQIARLVSTVGATHVKARFLVATQTQGELLFPHFTLALFATDDLNARLSSYYLADAYWETDPSPGNVGGEVPNVLVNFWLNNWLNDKVLGTEVTQAMFNSPYGFLRGYTFTIDDFVNPLSQVKNLEDATLQISFGLHEFYRTGTDGTDALNYTFGLVVQYLDGLGAPVDDPSFDMSQPCPPNC
ncbi:hypothetical protein GCM10023172_27810 [Hymenobacter ginsengisoli]|uniref:Uncharacterized protein n=1 Tax=Hymenobacter ginsengisoli TaxID=1051626 RepID=A0ABP8QK72_9BACT|nr:MULTISPECIES: hypothetical protein [unclassified Hymenobacter]MBO2029964.1 hypothetical protein [Hymenobacter sp. BT559]